MIVDVVQRWRDRRGVYRPARETIITAHYEVAPIPEREAKDFVCAHHYAHSMPAARWCFGLYWGGLIVGVAVFSHPVNDLVLTKFLPGAAIESVELGRLVLLDLVPANGESFFVARCFDLLRKENIIGVVSFADPVPRTTTAGSIVLVGHLGVAYQSLNGVYTGRGKARMLRLLPDGSVFSDRAAQKIRTNERGARYAATQLVAAGAPPIDLDTISEEQRRAWLRAATEAVTRPLRHGGNHRYVWGLDRKVKKYLPASLAYPKFDLPAGVLLAPPR